jgi:hypothetical protein
MPCLAATSSTVQAVGLHDTSTEWHVRKTWIFCIILRSRRGEKIFQRTSVSRKVVFVYILLIHRMDIQNEVITQMFKHKL